MIINFGLVVVMKFSQSMWDQGVWMQTGGAGLAGAVMDIKIGI